MEEKKVDSLYDKALMQIVIQPLVDIELAEFNKYNNIPHEYSDEFKKRLKKVFLREKIKHACKTVTVWGRRVAVCFIIVAMLALVACATIEPLREKIANAFVTWYEKYSIVSYEQTNIVTEFKLPTNIPNGFNVIYRNENDTSCIIIYENSEMNRFVYTGDKINDNVNWLVDNEGVTMEEVDLNGTKAVYFKPLNEYDVHLIMWEDGNYVYTVDTDISKEELINFAESIK